MNYTAISGHTSSKIIIQDSNGQQWQLVAADGTCTFEAIEHREIGYASRTREIALIVVQQIFGWNKPKKDTHLAAAPNGFGSVVICDDRAKGYAIAEPIWAKPSDDYALESARLHASLSTSEDRGCDRASSFRRY